ncbi:hypothetical protein IC575_002351 [Cucumis melo]|uniref:Isoamylase 2, chloroplastic n=1 Tax=Cucumis melo TaxID=3656 RepID=A0A1S3BRF8_CUCME|nr:isoamylase 2, chloroplastic [Cucumis melo]XP_050942755.1 isoamylase 2, chloroplastic [Cucumis melo]
MATFLSSLVIQPFCVHNCGVTESLKLAVSDHLTYGQKTKYQSGKMDEARMLAHGESKVGAVKSSHRNLSKAYVTSGILVGKSGQRLGIGGKSKEQRKVATYLFRTEFGDLVNVFVGKTGSAFTVNIEISSMQLVSTDETLLLSWRVYRSDSAPVTSNFQSSPPDGTTGATETPFVKTSEGKFSVELEFDAKHTPFYLSFVLKFPMGVDSGSSEIRSHRKTSFSVPVGFGRGYPSPLGLSISGDGSINFSIFSSTAESVVLCLYNDSTSEKPLLELDLDPYINRSGNIWHASFEGASNFVSYGYQCKGLKSHENQDGLEVSRIVVDPYAKILAPSIPKSRDQGLGFPLKFLGQISIVPAFDWDGEVRPNLPMEKLFVYRLNVKRFTIDKSSQLPADIAGTFSGLTKKLLHLKNLGVNAVLLEPIFQFDEKEGPYFPFHFFSPTNNYGPSGASISAINSMKEMVKELHANGVEVIVEVVYTHTSVDGALQGIDDSSYYFANRVANLEERSALNCNYPIVQQLLLDSLRYWVTEFHVDGFCFVNASFLLQGHHGELLSRPPFVEAIAFDPILSKTKLVADFWDPQELVSKETRFPHWKRWAEVNSKFCSDIRDFFRGEGLISSLATRLCGSGDVFSDGRGPAFSFNFIARNVGLPLVDLVSFSNSNLASELSWNCGEEGPTNTLKVLEKRLKQIRNFIFVLFVSLGVPVLNMGDECGQSSGGSVAFNDRRSFNWDLLKTDFGTQTTQFIAFLSSFRSRRFDLFQSRNFLKGENIDWFDNNQSPPQWEDASCKFLAVMLRADKEENESITENPKTRSDIFMAFNASDQSESVALPEPSEGTSWFRVVDTALPFPGFFSSDGELVPMTGSVTYEMQAHSCALFEAKSANA